MLVYFLICLLIFAGTYFISATGAAFLSKRTSIDDYHFKTDPFVYIFVLLFLATCAVFYFSPNIDDNIIKQDFVAITLPFLFSGLIYALYLLDLKKTFLLSVIALSMLMSFLYIDESALILKDFVPKEIEIACIGFVFAFACFGALALSGVAGVFSTTLSMSLLGLILLFFSGGLPLRIAFLAAAWLGLWSAIWQINNRYTVLPINAGAMVASMFLFCSAFFITGVNELSGTSVLILLCYPIIELFWALFQKYVRRSKAPLLCMDSVNFLVSEKGLPSDALHVAIAKLGLVNVFLSTFQLFASNAFTIPFLAFLISSWLLYKLNNFDQQEVTIKQTNKQFVQDVKESIKALKKHSQKDEENQ